MTTAATTATFDPQQAAVMMPPGMPPQAHAHMPQHPVSGAENPMNPGTNWFMPGAPTDPQGFAAPYDEASSELFATGATPWQGNADSGALDVQAAMASMDNYSFLDNNMWGNSNGGPYENMGHYGYN
jgi:hypothetical protein